VLDMGSGHDAAPASRATARQALIEALPAEYVVVAVKMAAMRSASMSGWRSMSKATTPVVCAAASELPLKKA
jgi:hypothetical protein